MKTTLTIAWFVFTLLLGGVFTAVIYKTGEWTGYSAGRGAMQDFCDRELVFRFEEGGTRYFCAGEGGLKPSIPMME